MKKSVLLILIFLLPSKSFSGCKAFDLERGFLYEGECTCSQQRKVILAWQICAFQLPSAVKLYEDSFFRSGSVYACIDEFEHMVQVQRNMFGPGGIKYFLTDKCAAEDFDIQQVKISKQDLRCPALVNKYLECREQWGGGW